MRNSCSGEQWHVILSGNYILFLDMVADVCWLGREQRRVLRRRAGHGGRHAAPHAQPAHDAARVRTRPKLAAA